jgi:hypothetical protein
MKVEYVFWGVLAALIAVTVMARQLKCVFRTKLAGFSEQTGQCLGLKWPSSRSNPATPF